MKASSTTLFRSLASKIHPQVILSQKESAQFLNALTASFRRQLDAEHPHNDASPSRAKAAAPLTLTERHVASVLTNPLLAHVTRQSSADSNGGRHPIDIFENLVAEGSASLLLATQCLMSFRRSLRKELPDARHRSIRQYQPGTKVLRWLWANGFTRSEVFHSDHNLYKAVVYFLVKEGRSNAVREWVHTASEEPVANDAHLSPKSILLDWLITCEAKSGRRALDRAIDTFMSFVRSSSNGQLRFAHLAGSQLASMLRLHTATSPSDIKPVLEFLEAYPRWKAAEHEPVSIDICCLRLQYDPIKAIDGALAMAKALNLENTSTPHVLYGEKPIQFLVSLSDAIQNVGTQAQATQFVQLLQTVEKDEGSKDGSLLSRAAHGIPSMLLREFEKVNFGPRQITV